VADLETEQLTRAQTASRTEDDQQLITVRQGLREGRDLLCRERGDLSVRDLHSPAQGDTGIS
jgi:hypothetical protein